jgi:hypothetical protein
MCYVSGVPGQGRTETGTFNAAVRIESRYQLAEPSSVNRLCSRPDGRDHSSAHVHLRAAAGATADKLPGVDVLLSALDDVVDAILAAENSKRSRRRRYGAEAFIFRIGIGRWRLSGSPFLSQ